MSASENGKDVSLNDHRGTEESNQQVPKQEPESHQLQAPQGNGEGSDRGLRPDREQSRMVQRMPEKRSGKIIPLFSFSLLHLYIPRYRMILTIGGQEYDREKN